MSGATRRVRRAGAHPIIIAETDGRAVDARVVAAIMAAAERGDIATPPGEFKIIHVLHDDTCRYLRRRGACDCSPEVLADRLRGAA